MIQDEKLNMLFWQAVQTPAQNNNIVQGDFKNDALRSRLKKKRLINFNLRVLEILKSPDCFELLKYAIQKWGDSCLLTTAIARLIVQRRKNGLYNSLYEIIS